MNTSWRINTRVGDKTQITKTSSEIVGAMVIKSYKGDKEFVRIDKGDTQRVLDIFGYPSKDYPSIQDALDSVTKSTMYIASPYKNGKFGGVFVTPSGTKAFVNGFEEKSIADFENIEYKEIIGITNGETISFEKQLRDYEKIDTNSIKVFKDSVNLNITIGEDGAITDDGGSLDEGSTYIEGNLVLKFKSAPTEGTLDVSYKIDMSDCYFVLFNKNQQSDDLRVKVAKNEKVDGAFSLIVERYNPSTEEYDEVKNSPFTFGLSENSKDNEGRNIYIQKVFGESQDLFTCVVNNSEIGEFTNDVNFVNLSGGNRGDDIEGSDIANVYNALKDTNKYTIKAVVDPTCSSECVAIFESLRNDYHKRCRFLYCTEDVDASEIIENPNDFNGGITNNRGMYCYTLTWGIHKDVYRGNDFNCSNMGLIYGKLADVLTIGGGVPAWIDEDGVGGILGSSITKLNRFASETQLEKLDDLCFNPVIMDSTYGAMIVSWKTRQVKETVFSYIGQSSLADTIIELVENNVLPTRLGKLIDKDTYLIVENGCDTLIKRYLKWIDDYLIICSDKNNDDESKDAQILKLTIGVIFKGYASKILFNFTADKHGVKLEESILQ